MWNQSVKKWWPWPKKNSKLNWWEKFKKILFYAVVIALPSNLFFKLSLQDAYVNGLLVDYLIPKLYLFDLLLVANILIFFIEQKNNIFLKIKKFKLKKIDIAILLILFIFLAFQLATLTTVGLINGLRWIMIIIFVLALRQNPHLKKDFYLALLISVLWQSFLAYYQFFNQHALAPYRWFGESNLQSFVGISRGSFFQNERILPYGSTAHPNILAGIVVIFSMMLVNKDSLNKDWQVVLMFNALMICIFSQSLSAFLSLMLFFLYLISQNVEKKYQKWKKNIFILSLCIIFLISPLLISKVINMREKTAFSLSRRQMLNQAAWKMFEEKPVFGFGSQAFVKEVENYSQNSEIVRFVQPVHHVGLLLLSEHGLLLVALLAALTWRYRKYLSWDKLLLLVPIASLDHYLLTQASGVATLILFLLSVSRVKKKRLLLGTKWEQW